MPSGLAPAFLPLAIMSISLLAEVVLSVSRVGWRGTLVACIKQHLGRAGSHEDGANFSTHSSLCRAAAETTGRDHRQKCSVFTVLHHNQEQA